MAAAIDVSPSHREPELLGQTVVVIGGSAGIGLETARRARIEGAEVVLTGCDPERLGRAASALRALSTAAFDATDSERLERFFGDLPPPIDHVMVTAGGPYYAALPDIDFAEARRSLEEHLFLALHVARYAADKVRPGGTLLFMGGTGARDPSVGLGISSAMAAALPALTASLAVEIAPVRVNLIAGGLRRHVAALAVHIMSNTALTGATYDIDGGQQLASLAPRPEGGSNGGL